jgi:uncharacterized protein (TIGR03083 family)
MADQRLCVGCGSRAEENVVINAGSISDVLDVLLPERAAVLELLAGLDASDWNAATECPAYTVKGIATHVLGDDLSLLSRQRDGAEPGLIRVAAALPGADFRTILDTFNDQWVAAAQFLSPALLIELLRCCGEWTADYYREVDPEAPGEPVGFFGGRGGSSPFWHAIAREYMERWVHHSQIRRALGMPSLADAPFLDVGIDVAASAAGVEARVPAERIGVWEIGPVALGPADQAAAILTRAYTADEVRARVSGPDDAVALVAMAAGR